MEPGSYPGTTRFPLFEKVTPLEFCMGTRFLPYWEPVPTYKNAQFLKIHTGNPVPPHREPVPTTCRIIFCYFDSIYAFQTIPNHSYTNYDFRNTKIQPLNIITTSYIMVSTFLLIVRHINSLKFYILTQNRVSSYKPIINFLTYPITQLTPKTHKTY